MKIRLLFLALISSFVVAAQTFTGTGGLISDNQQEVEFPIPVSGLSPTILTGEFGLLKVCLNIDHTYDSDLSVFLVSPSGEVISLFSGVGGGDNNFTNTCLSQNADQFISTGIAPFSGLYKPIETLGNMNNGQDANGIWKLRIQDIYAADEGTLLDWNITFGADAPSPFLFKSSNLPIVLVNTNNQVIVDEPSIVATMKIIDNGIGLLNYVTDTTFNYDGKINIEYRGNYSQTLPQKPYKVETLDDEEENIDVSLLGMPAESDWALLANYNDKVFMRNQLSYDLFSQMNHYGPKTRHCEVVINGKYQGVFILSETIKRNNNRVDIEKLNANENSGLDVTGGYIIKNDYWFGSDGWQLNNSPIDHPELTVGLAYHYPKADKISTAQKDYIAGFIDDFENALYSEDFTNPTEGYLKFLDEESFIDYFIINELSRNNDGFKKSCYFYKDIDTEDAISKLHAGPVWDFDWAWKNIEICTVDDVTDGSGWSYQVNDCVNDVYSTGWYVRLLQDPNFANNLKCRWEILRNTTLSTEAIFGYIDETAIYIDKAQERQFERWGNLGANTGTPEVDNDPATFEGQITKFKNWITTRIEWLDENMPGESSSCVLGMDTNTINDLLIVPNPSKEFVTVTSINGQNIKEIKVVDVSGKMLFRSNTAYISTTLDVSSFANGIYIIHVKTDTNVEIYKKLIVAH